MKKKNVRFVPMVKFVTATFWLGKPFCPLPFLSDCWVTISVVMEWNGMETDMAHGLVTMVSTGRSDRVVRWWPMTMMYPPTSSPPTHSYVRPCLHTSSTACYTGLRPRGGGGGWRCVWRSVDATALGCGPSTSTDGITTTTLLLQHDLQRNFVVGHRPRSNQSTTCEQRQRHLLVHWWIVNVTVGKSFSVGASPVRPSWKRTHGDRSSTNVNRATKRCTPHHWLGPLLACAADTDSAGPYVEPTTALRRGRRRRPPCLPIRRHPGK